MMHFKQISSDSRRETAWKAWTETLNGKGRLFVMNLLCTVTAVTPSFSAFTGTLFPTFRLLRFHCPLRPLLLRLEMGSKGECRQRSGGGARVEICSSKPIPVRTSSNAMTLTSLAHETLAYFDTEAHVCPRHCCFAVGVAIYGCQSCASDNSCFPCFLIPWKVGCFVVS